MSRTKELFEEIKNQNYNNEFFDKKIFYETLQPAEEHEQYA